MSATATSDKPKRQRKPKEGDVLAIPLGDGTYGFGQVGKGGGSYAYFDVRGERLLSAEEIVAHPIAFRVPTANDSAKEGGWKILGNLPPTGVIAEDAVYRNQSVGSNQLNIIKGNQVIPATYDEVKDLEVMSCWFRHQIVQRLLDHFDGRPNQEFERTRKIKVYDPKTGQEINPETGEPIKWVSPRTASQGQHSSQNTPSPVPKTATKPLPATATTLAKIHEFTAAYDQFIEILRTTDDDRLTLFTASVAGAVAQLKAWLVAGVDAKTARGIVSGVREGLRETPALLKSLVPDRGASLVSEVESKLGRKFSDF